MNIKIGKFVAPLVAIVASCGIEAQQSPEIPISHLETPLNISFDANEGELSPEDWFPIMESDEFKEINTLQTELTPGNEVSWQEATLSFDQFLEKDLHPWLRNASREMIAKHMLSHYLLVPNSPDSESATAAKAKYLQEVLDVNPTEGRVIYVGLSHLQGYWEQEKIQAAANTAIHALEKAAVQREKRAADLARNKPEVTPGFEGYGPGLKQAEADAIAEDLEYKKYLEALVSS